MNCDPSERSEVDDFFPESGYLPGDRLALFETGMNEGGDTLHSGLTMMQ